MRKIYNLNTNIFGDGWYLRLVSCLQRSLSCNARYFISLQAVNIKLTHFDATDLDDLQTGFHFKDFYAERKLV